MSARYLREVSPRHEGFEVEGDMIDAILVDAGLARVGYADHQNPHASLSRLKFRKSTGKRVRTPSPAAGFIRKSFGDLMPDDFNRA